MPLWKRLGFLFVFVVPALMPAAAWLGVSSGRPDLMAWFPLFFLFVLLPLFALGVVDGLQVQRTYCRNPACGPVGQRRGDAYTVEPGYDLLSGIADGDFTGRNQTRAAVAELQQEGLAGSGPNHQRIVAQCPPLQAAVPVLEVSDRITGVLLI